MPRPQQKNCIVDGCTSNIENEEFQRKMKIHGHAYCRFHQTDNYNCGCKSVVRFHSFPKSSEIRKYWFRLLGKNQDYVPERKECVCSKHFSSESISTSRFSFPTRNIGLTDHEVEEILQERVRTALEIQAAAAAKHEAETELRAAERRAIFELETSKKLFDVLSRVAAKFEKHEKVEKGDTLDSSGTGDVDNVFESKRPRLGTEIGAESFNDHERSEYVEMSVQTDDYVLRDASTQTIPVRLRNDSIKR